MVLDFLEDLAYIFDNVWYNIRWFFITIYLTITRLAMSIRQFRDYHLGTNVIYRNEVWTIYQIFALNGKMTFKIFKGKVRFRHNATTTASRFEVYKDRTLSNLIHDTFYWWDWYKRCWLKIDTRSIIDGRGVSSVQVLGKNYAHGKDGRYKQ